MTMHYVVAGETTKPKFCLRPKHSNSTHRQQRGRGGCKKFALATGGSPAKLCRATEAPTPLGPQRHKQNGSVENGVGLQSRDSLQKAPEFVYKDRVRNLRRCDGPPMGNAGNGHTMTDSMGHRVDPARRQAATLLCPPPPPARARNQREAVSASLREKIEPGPHREKTVAPSGAKM